MSHKPVRAMQRGGCKVRNVEIPATCLDLSKSFDVNRDWPCKRAAAIAHLTMIMDDIIRTERTPDRTRSSYRRGNLFRWVDEQTDRLEQMIPRMLDMMSLTSLQYEGWLSGVYALGRRTQ